jgi:hypothetical protein
VPSVPGFSGFRTFSTESTLLWASKLEILEKRRINHLRPVSKWGFLGSRLGDSSAKAITAFGESSS